MHLTGIEAEPNSSFQPRLCATCFFLPQSATYYCLHNYNTAVSWRSNTRGLDYSWSSLEWKTTDHLSKPTAQQRGNGDGGHNVRDILKVLLLCFPLKSSHDLWHVHKKKTTQNTEYDFVAQTPTVQRAISQRISSPHLCLTCLCQWKTTCVSSSSSQTREGKKQDGPWRDAIAWLSSHCRKRLRPLEQVLERRSEARGH